MKDKQMKTHEKEVNSGPGGRLEAMDAIWANRVHPLYRTMTGYPVFVREHEARVEEAQAGVMAGDLGILDFSKVCEKLRTVILVDCRCDPELDVLAPRQGEKS